MSQFGNSPDYMAVDYRSNRQRAVFGFCDSFVFLDCLPSVYILTSYEKITPLLAHTDSVLAKLEAQQSCPGDCKTNEFLLGKREGLVQYIVEELAYEGGGSSHSLISYAFDLKSKTVKKLPTITALLCNIDKKIPLNYRENATAIRYREIYEKYVGRKMDSRCIQTLNLTSYTNQEYPNLNIIYDKEWKLKVVTAQSQYQGLLEREIQLTKNQSNLTFKIVLYTKGNCEEAALFFSGEEGFFRIQVFPYARPNSNFFFYSNNPSGPVCRFDRILRSKFAAENYPDYYQSLQSTSISKDIFVKNTIVVSAEGTNDTELAEADNIVRASRFWSP